MQEEQLPISLILRENRRLLAENAQLRREVAELRAKLAPQETIDTPVEYSSEIPVTPESASFLFSLFRGRADVFSRRVVRKDGKAAYYPVCSNFWKAGLCPRVEGQSDVRCFSCPARAWEPISKRIIMAHLQGGTEQRPQIIGIYPLLEDETCRLLVFDFDDHDSEIEHWREDVDALRRICDMNKVPVLVERSRSGKGAHVWMFFEENIPASVARTFGSALLTQGAKQVNQKSFASYDRMIPAQDHMPEGGLGNLIALPLQGHALKQGNSAFVNADWTPYANQWQTLLDVKKISRAFVETKIKEWTEQGELGPLSRLHSEETSGAADEKPWETSRFRLDKGDVAAPLQLVRANMVWIAKEKIKPRFLNTLRRMAAFSNPAYNQARNMGFSVARIPRIIPCHEETEGYLGIPRGQFEELADMLKRWEIPYKETDKRCEGRSIDVGFTGKLYPTQQDAAERMLQHDNGILCAATAFGKTAVGAYLVAQRKVNTLVLVHNREIMKNWVDDFKKFLDIREEPPTYLTKLGKPRKRKSDIGCIYSAHDSSTGIIDIAMFTSLKEDDERLKTYGMVLMDECHHAAAASADAVLKRINARYVYGLTATPKRDDGMEQKVLMQFGPIRFRFTARQRAEMQDVQHLVYPRFTQLVHLGNTWKINDAYHALIADERRNALIVHDVQEALSKGHTPLVLTKFREHAETLRKLLDGSARHIVVLQGGRSTKERETIREQLAGIPVTETLVVIATGQYIGEGFNYPRLDTLMLATPIAWEGNVEQYAGRLHRDFNGKTVVAIYDYVDVHVRVLEKMYHKRLRTYKRMGYSICNFATEVPARETRSIFGGDDYEAYLERDILEARETIAICSPGINRDKVQWLASLAARPIARGVRIVVFTLPPADYPEEYKAKADAHIQRLRQLAIDVVPMQGLHEHLAIIDKNAVWYGSVNILSRNKENDIIIRLEDSQMSRDLSLHLGKLANGSGQEQGLLPLPVL